MAGKIIIKCLLEVKTGLHIGNSDSFSAIGAIDSPVVRDSKSGLPIVPGSSLKGKIRFLLVKNGDNKEMPKDCNSDPENIRRIFGASDPVCRARLQFSDAFISNVDEMRKYGFTESKAENHIARDTAKANLRFIERVNPGTEFAVCLVYNIDKENEIDEDFNMLARGLKLLMMDYLGGHGSRGSGRVSFKDFKLEKFETDIDITVLEAKLNEVSNYELLSV